MRIAALILAAGAAFAALPASDNFVAANGTALTTYSANWTAVKNTFTIQSNSLQCGTGGDYCFATWNADSFPNDQYSQVTISAVVPSSYVGPTVRGTTSSFTGYICIAESSSSLQIQRISAGAFAATVGSVYTGAIAPGDVIRLEVTGTTLTCKQNGVTRASGTDATIASGSAGVAAFNNGISRQTTWSAGSLSTGPTISNSAVDNITAHGARFAWDTDVASTAAKVKVGTSNPPTTVIVPLIDSSYTTHVWFASGLTAGTLYYWQVCSTSTGETCTTASTFTTSAEPSGVATQPTAPSQVTTTYPSITGTTYTVASDCSDLQSKIDTAATQDGSLTHLVSIPAGTECVGRYTMPAKSGSNPTGDGFIVIQSAGTLAPAGSQTSSTYAANAAVIVANFLNFYYQASDPATCNSGDGLVRTDTFQIKYCTAANIWTAQTVTTGAGAPSSTCTANAWYRNTSEADTHKAFWWCTATNKNRNVYVDSNGAFNTYWAGIGSAGGVKGYRVVGIKIQDLERPTAYTSLLSTSSGNGDEIGSKSFCLAYTTSTDSYIFFDRVYWEGQGQPHRQQDALCRFDGSNVAVVDSYFSNINVWRPTGALESNSHCVFFVDGVGPVKITGNYFLNTSGMAVFNSDDNPVGQTNDVTIDRNTFFVDTTLNTYESVNLGRLYYFRHHIEMKRGARWLISGNTFTGGFPIVNSGAALGLTPRNGSASSTQCRTNTNIVSDVNIQFNKFLYLPQGMLLTGHNDGGNCNTYGSIRISIQNNVTYYIGTSSTGNQRGPTALVFNGQFANTGLGFEDVTFNNNLLSQSGSATELANMWSFAGDWLAYPNSRWDAQNNMYFASSFSYWFGVWRGGLDRGTVAINYMIVPNSTYSFNGNARMRGITGGIDDGEAYPGTNYSSQTPSDFSSAIYQCSVCGDEAAFRPIYNQKFAAASSTARGANGNDNGPDYDAFDVAQGGMRNQRALSVTSTTASIYWTAPDATTVATIEFGTSATPGTGTRVTDTPTSRFRSKGLTGLSGGTTYYYRVYMGGMVSGSFTTP